MLICCIDNHRYVNQVNCQLLIVHVFSFRNFFFNYLNLYKMIRLFSVFKDLEVVKKKIEMIPNNAFGYIIFLRKLLDTVYVFSVYCCYHKVCIFFVKTQAHKRRFLGHRKNIYDILVDNSFLSL